MRKLAVTTFVTLDGVMQAPGGPEEDRSGGFRHGGWLVPHADEDMGRQMVEWFSGAEDFLTRLLVPSRSRTGASSRCTAAPN